MVDGSANQHDIGLAYILCGILFHMMDSDRHHVQSYLCVCLPEPLAGTSAWG